MNESAFCYEKFAQAIPFRWLSPFLGNSPLMGIPIPPGVSLFLPVPHFGGIPISVSFRSLTGIPIPPRTHVC